MADAVAPESLETVEAVKDYYGKELKTRDDNKSGMCQTPNEKKYPKHVLEAMRLVHEDVSKKYYGCGPVFPQALKGSSVLDLGSGSGMDCFVLSKAVGAEGSVTGIDLTDEQLDVSRSYIDYHTKLYNYSKPNVKFIKGNMESMEEAGIESSQFDIIVSNCVVNLAKSKRAVLSEAYRVLKEGGEFHFSDIYASKDLPPKIRENEQMWCECIVGALWWKNFYELAKEVGFSPPRLVSAGILNVTKQSYLDLLGDTKLVSVVYSLYKLPANKSGPKTVEYKGTIQDFEEEFKFDHGITFKKGEVVHVNSEIATILQSSRFNKYFTFSDGEKGPLKDSETEKDPFEFCAQKNGPK